ncbi:MAG: hypothetical protein A2017_10005 [Lentisphaerae bacterium GWF2_44_16]|nr:MAG: hypothetical protein A2017_10005 [Lentisphaerae bacterium GWF2_44_16]
MMEKMITTYSMWKMFRNCRKACEWRYFQELVPLEKERSLAFGSIIHQCLELWHKTRRLDEVLSHIDRAYVNRIANEREKSDWHLARAMMRAYAQRYPDEKFEVVHLEQKFSGPIINPETGAESRTFVLAGKVDGIVKLDNAYYLLEHKTASQIDAGYLDRLWTDFQICLYSWYVEKYLGYKISGIIYNVLAKAKLKQSQGESEAEFEERRNELIAKSKSGTSSAKRKMPETDEEFQVRLAEKYSDPQMFHREILYISRDKFLELQGELWELSQAMLEARRRKAFYMNTDYCFMYNRPCAYYALCSSGGNPNLIENMYEKKAPHEELSEANINTQEAPIF